MSFKFPFTNYHELNLTWVLDQLKKLFEDSAENVSVIQTYDGRLSAVETELPTVSETASEASRAASAAGTLAQTAKATADTAQENALQAQGLAGTARQEAQAAQTAADAATQAAQQAQAIAQNFDGRITQAENDASQALEASRSFENRVQSAITTANNAARTATDAQGVAQNANQNAAAALDKIGDLSQLTTPAKNNIVAAINDTVQAAANADGKAEAAQTAAANADGKAEATQTAASNIAGSIAPVEETATASRSYTVDDLLMYNNRLYKVASAIAAGGTLTPGTNITNVTVDSELDMLGDQIDSLGTAAGLMPLEAISMLDDTDYGTNIETIQATGRRITKNVNRFTIRYVSSSSSYRMIKLFGLKNLNNADDITATYDESLEIPAYNGLTGGYLICKARRLDNTSANNSTIRVYEVTEDNIATRLSSDYLVNTGNTRQILIVKIPKRDYKRRINVGLYTRSAAAEYDFTISFVVYPAEP